MSFFFAFLMSNNDMSVLVISPSMSRAVVAQQTLTCLCWLVVGHCIKEGGRGCIGVNWIVGLQAIPSTHLLRAVRIRGLDFPYKLEGLGG